MTAEPHIKPLPRYKRRYTFWLLLTLFVAVLPFLYFYATGYRFDFSKNANFTSTGGLFIAADETGVEIYIDNELVRETRVFRKAYYAQNIDPGTHRVHVQKEGFHTWVKELPVYPHLVSGAQAFNLPLVPHVRPVTRFETSTGTPLIVTQDFGALLLAHASSSESVVATTTIATSTLVRNQEFVDFLKVFDMVEATSTPRTRTTLERVETVLENVGGTATTTKDATTTKEFNNVRLFQDGEDVYATWIGSREGMPYYYCAKDFDPLPKDDEGNPIYATEATTTAINKELPVLTKKPSGSMVGPQQATVPPVEVVNLPIQKVLEGVECTPQIRIDRKWQQVKFFDFFPGSTDLVMMVLEHGVYAVEIDDRSWQNVQPILEGENLDARIYNGHIVVYDGSLFYEMQYE